MKSKRGYYKWSNGYIELCYLDSDFESFNSCLVCGNVGELLDLSVLETNLKTGAARSNLDSCIKSELQLKEHIKRMNLESQH